MKSAQEKVTRTIFARIAPENRYTKSIELIKRRDGWFFKAIKYFKEKHYKTEYFDKIR